MKSDILHFMTGFVFMFFVIRVLILTKKSTIC